MNIGDPFAVTPRPSKDWRTLSDPSRIAAAAEVIVEKGWSGVADVVTAVQTGTVTVQFKAAMSAGERGVVARTLEAHLQRIDAGITVSTMPKIDRNRIRQLRGVTIL